MAGRRYTGALTVVASRRREGDPPLDSDMALRCVAHGRQPASTAYQWVTQTPKADVL